MECVIDFVVFDFGEVDFRYVVVVKVIGEVRVARVCRRRRGDASRRRAYV